MCTHTLSFSLSLSLSLSLPPPNSWYHSVCPWILSLTHRMSQAERVCVCV